MLLRSQKKIVLVGAFTASGVYGHNGDIPWSFKEDFNHFKRVTGHASSPPDTSLVMGKGTRDSMPTIPNRELIVVTSDPHYVAENSISVLSVREAIDTAKHPNVALIGGARVWEEGLLVADEIWVTIVGRDLSSLDGVKTMRKMVSLSSDSRFKLVSADMLTCQKDRKSEKLATLTFEHWVKK